MSALDPSSHTVLTPASTVMDEETTFWYEHDTRSYTPTNFGDKFEGLMTLRYALAHSKNIPAVKVAEMVGYDKVAEVARAVGMNHNIQPTPSIALGSYEVTPLEIASAYTVFPNGGDLLKNGFIKTIRDGNGATAFQAKPERKPAIDPRVAFLVESMMEDVLRGSGTGARARSMGFTLPAAGKTGTSRDGWFAGFTSKIICVVWVGFDDNRDFKLEGAKSALPIWVEFMKRAHQHAGIQERAFLPAAGRHRHRRYRRGNRRAGRAELSQGSQRGVHRREPAAADLPHSRQRPDSGFELGSGAAAAPPAAAATTSSSTEVAAVQSTQPAQAPQPRAAPQKHSGYPAAGPAGGTGEAEERILRAAQGHFQMTYAITFWHVGIVILLAGLAPAMRADATLRYHTEIQTTPLIPAGTLDQTLASMRDMVVQIKGNKAYSSQGKLTSIVDLTTQEMILVDVANKRFADPAGQYGQQVKAAIPAVPEQARAVLDSMKSHFESRSTGRTAVIQGIQAEEQEFVLTMDMALPGGPATPSPFMKMVMQVWTAKPEEAQRVPALQEFKNYTAIASFSMNSTEAIKQVLSILPGMGDGFSAMMAEMSKKGAMSLRMHTEVAMPFLAGMMQQMPPEARRALPAGLDPNGPLMQMNQELVELSSDPLDEALFVVPADYQLESLAEILRSAIPAAPPPSKK